VCLILAVLFLGNLASAAPSRAQADVCFTPAEDCTAMIVNLLDHAKDTILVQAYSFTSAPIAKALVDAYKRGVQVRAILDKSNKTDKYSGADFLAHAGIPVLIDAKHAIAHSKIMIVDHVKVVTGSFNFTKSAQCCNAENVVILKNQKIIDRYIDNWQRHAAHSDPFVPKAMR
jgi:phosphatidylserine/phosphatidylglycerophosphate/cardiolipin synthase-like enzyme